jgi:hypothetical protein
MFSLIRHGLDMVWVCPTRIPVLWACGNVKGDWNFKKQGLKGGFELDQWQCH